MENQISLIKCGYGLKTCLVVKIEKNVYYDFFKIVGLSAGMVSLLFSTLAFFVLMIGYDFYYWTEPNKSIAALEFVLSGAAVFILICFLYDVIKGK